MNTPAKANETPAPKKADTKKLTFAELSALAVGDLATHLKKIVRVDLAINKAKDAMTASIQFHAKCVAALKRAYVNRLNSREIPPDTKFSKYFEQNADGKLPGRVETLATLFNALVLTVDANGKPLLSEECFDAAAVDWLEKANPIVKVAQKAHGDAWKTCDDVLDLVNALSHPGDALKKIKEIRKRQTGKGDSDGENTTEVLPLTVGRAVEFLKAAITNASKMDAEAAYSLYADTIQIGDAWVNSGLSDATLNGFVERYDKAVKMGIDPHIAVLDTETPETPGGELQTAQAVAA